MDSPIKIQTAHKFRTDVWREVPFEAESNKNTRNYFPLNDYKTISFRIAANSAEKKRRSLVLQNLQKKQIEWNTKLEDRLQQVRDSTAKESQERLKLKNEETEEILLHIINKIEESCRIDDEFSKSEKHKIDEHNNRLVERAKELKISEENRNLHEAFKKIKAVFVAAFNRFVETIKANQLTLNTMGKYSAWVERTNEIVKSYQTVIETVVPKKMSPNDIKSFQIVCNDIETEQKNLEMDLENYVKTLSAAAASNGVEQTDGANGVIANSSEYIVDNTNVAVVAQTPVPEIPLPVSVPKISSFVTPERLEYYKDLEKFHNEYMTVIKPLINNTDLKQFMFNCKKAVNTPVNAIAARSQHELQDKFDKIYRLLSGSDQQLLVTRVPGGIEYCHWLLANKFVDQASTISTSTNPQTIFAVAAIIVAIWQHFPVFGKLFLALLYQECPFLLPSLIPRSPGQDEKSYMLWLGYRIRENVIETENQFLKRVASIQSLYSAILLTELSRNRKSNEHPHSLENGWIWITNILNLEPLPRICSTLLVEFIQVCGSEMIHVYKTQFQKLLIAIHQQYMPKLNAIETGGPKARLEAILSNFMKGNPLPPPSGKLPANFW